MEDCKLYYAIGWSEHFGNSRSTRDNLLGLARRKKGFLTSEIAARNRRSLATFHRTLKSQCIIAFSCLGNRTISGGRDGHRNRKSQQLTYGVIREGVIAENFPQISAKFPQTFRRISAPFPGAIKRISLQISANFHRISANFPQKPLR